MPASISVGPDSAVEREYLVQRIVYRVRYDEPEIPAEEAERYANSLRRLSGPQLRAALAELRAPLQG
jgi:hypothetical protein